MNFIIIQELFSLCSVSWYSADLFDGGRQRSPSIGRHVSDRPFLSHFMDFVWGFGERFGFDFITHFLPHIPSQRLVMLRPHLVILGSSSAFLEMSTVQHPRILLRRTLSNKGKMTLPRDADSLALKPQQLAQMNGMDFCYHCAQGLWRRGIPYALLWWWRWWWWVRWWESSSIS